MRAAFISELMGLAGRHENIFLVVGDLGYSVVEPFADKFPDRFINAGVAEQNMTGVAAGLASEGYHVFTYSIANFSTFRCAEQIRNDIAYHGLSVTVVAVGGGVSYGNLGYSHHAVQDIALMRAFPGLTIACPGDPEETRACLRALVAKPGPSYLRLGRAGERPVHLGPVQIEEGSILDVRSAGPTTKALLSTGGALQIAKTALSDDDLSEGWGVYSLPLWSEKTREQVIAFVAKHQRVITVEDHFRMGGFGSFIQEMLDGKAALRARVVPIALENSIAEKIASQARLNEIGGLSISRIRQAMRDPLGFTFE